MRLTAIGKSVARDLLTFYARRLPHHFKKDGLVVRLSAALGLDTDEPLPTTLWFGGRMLCRTRDVFERRTYYFGARERKSEEVFSCLVRPGHVVIDVGANIGTFTLLASLRAGPAGRVVALEPFPSTYEQLERSLALNGCTNVVSARLAAWNEAASLHMSSATEPKDHAGVCHVAREGDRHLAAVEATTLDALATSLELPRVDVIKLDIEGAELPALEGAEQILSTWRPVLLLEVDQQLTARFGYTPERLAEYLRQFDYQGYALYEDYRAAPSRLTLEPCPELRFDRRDNYLLLPVGADPPVL